MLADGGTASCEGKLGSDLSKPRVLKRQVRVSLPQFNFSKPHLHEIDVVNSNLVAVSSFVYMLCKFEKIVV